MKTVNRNLLLVKLVEVVFLSTSSYFSFMICTKYARLSQNIDFDYPLVGLIYLIAYIVLFRTMNLSLYHFSNKFVFGNYMKIVLVSNLTLFSILMVYTPYNIVNVCLPLKIFFDSVIAYMFLLVEKRYSKATIKKSIVIIGETSSLNEYIDNILNNINFDIGSKYYIESSCDIEAALDFAFETLNIDYVIILPRTDQHQVDKIVSSALSMRKLCFIVPNVEEIAVQKSHITYFGDILTFRIDKMGLSFEQRFIKRSLDIAVSLTALILLLPILIIVYLLIFFSDGENPIFTQERLSRDRKHFKLIKFRTMIPDAEMKTGPVLSTKNDDRITKLGRFLRRTRIDELPQLINVLRGEMSIVGPRPEREVFVKDFIKSDKNYAYRYRVKAGITGLAQVKGKYNTSFYDKVRMDLFYIQNYSLLMDIKIMLSTFVVFFKSSKAEGVSSKTETIIQKKSNSESEYVYIID